MAVTWRGLDRQERETMMALAALHRELGPDAAFESDSVALVMGRPCVGELGFLTMYGLAELAPDGKGYRLNGEGFAVLPDSEERRRLNEHREAADQALREEQ
jgi:hypothetical protein